MRVKSGLEVFLEDRLYMVKGDRVGVVAHPASVNSRLEHIVDLFFRHPRIQLTTIMGPQHGARGETQDNMVEWQDYRDPLTGLPVYSLYSATRRPTEEMLSDVDVVVVDLQDVGARYYTFIHTMALVMEAVAEMNKRVIVLDRPNPINGIDLEGNLLDSHFRSFVGWHPLLVRHAMTVAELALYFNSKLPAKCFLEVVGMQGWKREMFFRDTGLPWILPSPNMPYEETALVYPGICLLEGTNVSEGRGTTRPFELSGAPWVEPHELAETLQSEDLPGAVFRPIHFIPTFHKWSDQMVAGVQIHVRDRSAFRPFRTGLALLLAYRESGGSEFKWKDPPYEYVTDRLPIDIICGTDKIRHQIEQQVPLRDIERGWEEGRQAFETRRKKCLLY